MGQAKLRGTRDERVAEAKNLLLNKLNQLDAVIRATPAEHQHRIELTHRQWQRLYRRYAHVW